jgi:hypothetical protein
VHVSPKPTRAIFLGTRERIGGRQFVPRLPLVSRLATQAVLLGNQHVKWPLFVSQMTSSAFLIGIKSHRFLISPNFFAPEVSKPETAIADKQPN